MNIRMGFKSALVFVFLSVLLCSHGFSRTGLPLEMLISADELRKMQVNNTRFVLLDARKQTAYDEGHIQGAIPVPRTDEAIGIFMRSYAKNTPVVAYCNRGCQASAVLIMKIKRLGFSNVKDMEEGIEVWREKGYPVAR